MPFLCCLIVFVCGQIFGALTIASNQYPTEKQCLEKLPRNQQCKQFWSPKND